MVTKNTAPNPDQEAMFSLEDIAPRNHIPEAGVSVRIEERAEHLLHTLNLIGKYRQRNGFQEAAHAESPHRRLIEERYRNSTRQVVRGAEINGDQAEKDARWQFAFATGQITLSHSGLIDEETLKHQTNEDYSNFTNTFFGDRKATNKRNRFRVVLDKQLRK